MGNSGATLKLQDGSFISPLNGYLYYGSVSRGWGGLIKYDANGDTIYFKSYTDTLLYDDNMLNCAILPHGGFLVGGGGIFIVQPHHRLY